jgi:hypothetical protein
MRILAAILLIAFAAPQAGADDAGARVYSVDREWHQNRPAPKKGFKYPECFCTDSSGQRVDLGKTTCLKIGSQQVLARCDMSLNNPTWRRIQEGCPTS